MDQNNEIFRNLENLYIYHILMYVFVLIFTNDWNVLIIINFEILELYVEFFKILKFIEIENIEILKFYARESSKFIFFNVYKLF